MELDDSIKTVDVMFESSNSSNGNSDNPRFDNLKQFEDAGRLILGWVGK
jgi:hypothetical protein